jgi:glycerol-3-phosphate dehydrogenase
LLHDACRHGAIALNYLPVTGLECDRGAARGVHVRDTLSGQSQMIAARAVVNCAGPGVHALACGAGGDVERIFRPSLAFNLLLDISLPTQHALAVASPRTGAQMLFVVPQAGSTLAGTMHLGRPPDTIEAVPSEPELREFIEQLNEAIPGLDARLSNVRRVFAGLLPVTSAGGAELVKREVLLDHGTEGGVGRFYSVSGVKFTTANDVARQVLAMIGVADAPAGEVSEMELSPATALLTDARVLSKMDRAAADAALRRVVDEEAVCLMDDLVLRRTNWATTEADLARVRERISWLDSVERFDTVHQQRHMAESP